MLQQSCIDIGCPLIAGETEPCSQAMYGLRHIPEFRPRRFSAHWRADADGVTGYGRSAADSGTLALLKN